MFSEPLPPYNTLLGGKLVACLVRTREIYEDFVRGLTGERQASFRSRGRMHVFLPSRHRRLWVARRVYNRLKLNGIQYFQSIGLYRRMGTLSHSRRAVHRIARLSA